jgi:hypothetical protein
MQPWVPVVVSGSALLVSILTAWLTLWRRGMVKMTQPTVIYFGYEKGNTVTPKVHLRTLLYATSKRGRVIESLYVRLRRGDTTQNFAIWIYGEKELSRGSGLYVPESGVGVNHHFLLPRDITEYRFVAGEYNIGVYAVVIGRSVHELLFSTTLNLSMENARQISENRQSGIYFDWSPDARRYDPHFRAFGSAVVNSAETAR